MTPWERARQELAAPEAAGSGLKPWERAKQVMETMTPGSPAGGDQASSAPDLPPDPEIAAYTAEVLSGDPSRARRAIVRDEFERMSGPRRALVAADDIVRLTADGLGFGLPDTVGGYLSEKTGIGPTRDERRQNTEDARSRAGLAGLVAEAAGGAKTLMSLPGISPTQMAANRGLAARLAAGGAEGMAASAASEIGHGRDVDGADLTIGAVTGAGGRAVAEAAGAAGNALGQGWKRLRGQVPKVPTLDELRAASQAAYKASEDAGVVVSGKGLNKLLAEIQGEWANLGYRPGLHRQAARFYREIVNDAKRGNITLKGLDGLRQVARSAYTTDSPATNKMLEKAVKRIDRFIETMDPATDMVMGDKQAGVAALKQARELWHRMAKADQVQQAIERGMLKASTNASGGNVENEVRKEIRRLVTNPKKTRGWTQDEIAAAKQVASGTITNNALRQLGRTGLQGNGVGLMFGGIGIGDLMRGNPVPLAMSIGGTIAKPISTAMSNSRARNLAELMRAGGSQAAVRGPQNALQRLSQGKRDLLARLLMSGALPPMQQAVNGQ